MESINFAIDAEPLVTETVETLVCNLDPTLHYHSPAHTQDVLKQTLELAEADGLDDRDVLLLAIAAAFHDAGFSNSGPRMSP